MAGSTTPVREVEEAPGSGRSPDVHAASRRRFTITTGLALGGALIPYLWVLWDGRLDPLRGHPAGLFSNFYDLQARALAHGHWWVPKGRLGVEAFVIDGRDYMYFGPFPALLRMPILALTDSLDGRLTAPSMLLAWLVTGLFSSLLVWRTRTLMRDSAVMGRVEATGLGLFLATIMCGSTLLFLASIPAVYEEALAWGVALTVGALFALLGVLERPSAIRVVVAGALTLGAVLSRSTLGWGCVIGAVLVAAWFASSRAGARRRQWSLPVLAAGLVPLAIGCTVTWVKFGDAFVQPLGAQVYSHVNKHRHLFLVRNSGKSYSLDFAPSTLWAYLRPDGLRISSVYPFITLPSRPAAVLGGVFMDQIYRTSSVSAAMPLLFILGCWGIISVFRPRPPERTNVLRLPVFAAGACGAGVLAWGGIAPRFTADFLPLLVLAGTAGLIDIFRRMEGRSQPARVGVVAGVAVLALFCMAANLGIATETTRLAFANDQTRDYVETQRSVADATGQALDVVQRRATLPRRAPANQLVVIDDCALGLYLSTGENYYPRWLPVELPRRVLDVTYQAPNQPRTSLVSVPPSTTVSVEDGIVDGVPVFRFRIEHDSRSRVSRWRYLKPGAKYRVEVLTDTARHAVTVDGPAEVLPLLVEDRNVPISGPAVVRTNPAAPSAPAMELVVQERRAPAMTLCRKLSHSR